MLAVAKCDCFCFVLCCCSCIVYEQRLALTQSFQTCVFGERFLQRYIISQWERVHMFVSKVMFHSCTPQIANNVVMMWTYGGLSSQWRCIQERRAASTVKMIMQVVIWERGLYRHAMLIRCPDCVRTIYVYRADNELLSQYFRRNTWSSSQSTQNIRVCFSVMFECLAERLMHTQQCLWKSWNCRLKSWGWGRWVRLFNTQWCGTPGNNHQSAYAMHSTILSISRMRLFVCARSHSSAFAVWLRVPTSIDPGSTLSIITLPCPRTSGVLRPAISMYSTRKWTPNEHLLIWPASTQLQLWFDYSCILLF